MTSTEPILPWIWRYLRPYRGRVVALVTLSCLEVLLRILSPWPMKAVVDHVLGATPLPPLLASALAPFASVASLVEGERERQLVAIVAAGLVIQLLHQLVHGHALRRRRRGRHPRHHAHLRRCRLAVHERPEEGTVQARWPKPARELRLRNRPGHCQLRVLEAPRTLHPKRAGDAHFLACRPPPQLTVGDDAANA